MTQLTRVLHVLMDGDIQPRVVTCLGRRISNKLVIVLIQTEVVTTNMALKVRKYLVVTTLKPYQLAYLYWTLVK